MYQITDIFEPQHAQTTMMEKSENGSSQFWKPWEEDDEAIISKSFTPVWEFSPLFSITDEILKRYVKCWSRGERIQLIEFVASEDKSDQDKKRNENESNEFRIQRSEPQRSSDKKTKLLEYIASTDKIYQDQKFKGRKEALAVTQRRRCRGGARDQ